MQDQLRTFALVEVFEARGRPLPFGRKDARHHAVRAEAPRGEMGELGHESLADVLGDAWKGAEARQEYGVTPPHHLGVSHLNVRLKD